MATLPPYPSYDDEDEEELASSIGFNEDYYCEDDSFSSVKLVLDNGMSLITPNPELALALVDFFPECEVYKFTCGEKEFIKDSFIVVGDYKKNMYGY